MAQEHYCLLHKTKNNFYQTELNKPLNVTNNYTNDTSIEYTRR